MEMSIEEKAKAYEQAIKRAKAMIPVAANQEEIYNSVITIFPELKEENERVWLTKFIQEEIDCIRFDIRDDEDRIKLENLQRSLSWLEKKCEPKKHDVLIKVEPKFKVGDIITPKDRGHEPWQIMQVDTLDKKYRFKDGYVIHFSQEDNYELVEQNAWSEEDERNIKELLYLVEANYLNSEEPHDRLINFLKFLLKDRVQLQPKLKKEWSKEEEKMLDEMYEFFDKHKIPSLKHDMDDYAKFIKSLKSE